MTTARRLLAGAAWSYGAQAISVIAQFVYAAITSRALDAEGFGAYAVALAASGLVALLAVAGLGQSVSRMVVLEKRRLQALVAYALVVGGAAGAVLFVGAPLWAGLWRVEAATEPIRWLAISTSLSPLFGLATALTARLGKFRSLALITLVSNLGGMFIGAAAVLTYKTASSLVVSAVVAQILTLIGSLFVTEKLLIGVASLRHGRHDIGYSGKLASTSFLSYLTGNLVKFSMTRGIAASSLGYWNRAEVLTLIPFQQVQGAIIRAVSPEFRHDVEESTRARTVWTDLLSLVSLLSFAAGAVAFILVPPLVPLLFGGGWELTANLAGPLAAVGALQILSTLLATAVETLGRFRWIVQTEMLLISVQVCGAILVLILHDIWIAVVALVVTNLVRHGWHVWLLGRADYLDTRRLFVNYGLSLFVASAIALWLRSFLFLISDQALSWIFWVLFVLMSVGLFAMWKRHGSRLPAVVIARKYGLLKVAK